ncbi:hypothetical protein [Halalkalicoccus jeotgali]|uniref:Uncharacterized protein n=1 Tax=Halalkalicoccus jeotgali (strain DSM 18796 / CECT 7217 / JCM 14584 / KCTC 4019 / B3) TaxID=795797 RepID=D8J451_HALJB|nr:hypothetical protein [Halalkalicoccus jeotgali]ADJ15443.1 hypothetical protein HacjB3_10300 [Halalkalicoccus jeotgali B3]ELY36148.1 hypothetical protein C497_12367 [Halalkalicoccus jeotgali B3]
MDHRVVKLLLAMGIGVIVLAASTDRTGRERGCVLRYVSTQRIAAGGAIALIGVVW